MREIDRLGPPGETMSRGTVFFLTGDTERVKCRTTLCATDSREIVRRGRRGAEKMVAVCGVGRRTLEMEVSRSPFAGTMMDSPWESSRCSESSRRVEETWFLGFEYFPTLCGKFRSDFNFFSGKKQRQLLLRKLNILEIP